MKICIRFLVSGRVQGVWYRASTQQVARQLELTGHARNLLDGRVEVLACGPRERLNELESWLWQGPVHARVTGITKKELEPCELDSFEIA
jgi:acylphosphatase